MAALGATAVYTLVVAILLLLTQVVHTGIAWNVHT